MQFSAADTLQTHSTMHLAATQVERFRNNPHVLFTESVALHLSRMIRLAAYILPTLQEEFKDHPEAKNLEQDLLLTAFFHDDDEIIAEYDELTFNKNHNANDEQEIANFKKAHQLLPAETLPYLTNYFEQFRHKTTLAAKIAKVLDNLTGNQFAIEHQIGMINPDYALVCIEYVEKVRGVSQTTDALIDAQIEQIKTLRQELQTNHDLLSHLAYALKDNGHGHHSDILNNMIKLLRVDIDEYEINRDHIYTPVWEYDIDSPVPLHEED